MKLLTKPDSPSTLDRRSRAYQRFARAVDSVPWLEASLPYNVTVADEPPLVWYRVAKVGTRTIMRHLTTHTSLKMDHPYQVRLPRAPYDEHFHFAFVRNPWDRLVSCWHEKVLASDHFRLGRERERLRSFPAFVEYVMWLDVETCDPHLRSQAALVDLNRVEFVGRFERFAEDLAIVCRRLRLPEGFSHRNPTEHAHYSHYYDDRTAEAVGRFYERDLRIFGYEFELSSSP
jgi:hypothetical protein